MCYSDSELTCITSVGSKCSGISCHCNVGNEHDLYLKPTLLTEST